MSKNDSEQRIKKLEASVSILLGLILGHLFTELILSVFFG